MLLTAALFVAAPAATFAAQAQPVRDTISVTGSASSENEPDMATVSLSMTERGKTAAEARRALASRIDKFNAFTASLRISNRDVKTTGYELEPNFEIVRDKRVQKGYAAAASYSVTMRKLTDLGALIDGSADRCGASVSGVSFGLQDREKIERGLLAAAVEDAKARASVVAKSGGRTLGMLVSANIGSAGAVPAPRAFMKMAANFEDSAAPETQLSAGVIKVSVSMSLIFELK